jgi:hypothetical protein
VGVLVAFPVYVRSVSYNGLGRRARPRDAAQLAFERKPVKHQIRRMAFLSQEVIMTEFGRFTFRERTSG